MKESKEIREILSLGMKLDELSYETYTLFSKQEEFDRGLIHFWADMAEWKKSHLKYWKQISKTFVYKNLFGRPPQELKDIVKQLKSIQTEIVEFMRRLKKKKITQDEAISQTILNEFCLVSDIFLEIFFSYDESVKDTPTHCVDECEVHFIKMANTLKPYLKFNPLFAVLLKSIVEMKGKYDFLLRSQGKVKKAAG